MLVHQVLPICDASKSPLSLTLVMTLTSLQQLCQVSRLVYSRSATYQAKACGHMHTKAKVCWYVMAVFREETGCCWCCILVMSRCG